MTALSYGIVRDGGVWRDRAACKGQGPSLFYPENPYDRQAVRVAHREFCSRCPVAQECADYAVANNIVDGLWGGMTVTQRRVARRESGIPSPRSTEAMNEQRRTERRKLADRIYWLRRHGTTKADVLRDFGMSERQYYRLLNTYPEAKS